MDTIIRKITDNEQENLYAVRAAAQVIRRGGLVAFPTETVYGLGADAFDEKAAEKIYAAKGRPSDNPLIVHIAEKKDLERLTDHISRSAALLTERFWPGPLTIIVPKSDAVPLTVTGGLQTVAVRLPSHPVARKLIAESKTLIAAPSANLSGRPSPTTAAHVTEDLNGRIEMILDAGAIEIGLESTIVDLTGKLPMLLRPGYITLEMLEAVLGTVLTDPALMTGVQGDIRPKAPGMKYRHYAPRAELAIVSGKDRNAVVYKLQELVDQALDEGKKTGVMLSEENRGKIRGGDQIILGSSARPEEIAGNLFAALRAFDAREADVIYSESFSTQGFGQAVMNRLLKAAGQKVIDVTVPEKNKR